MTLRKHTPLHDFWTPRVEGQIRDAMHAHPEWFSKMEGYVLKHAINGITKRIVGEIVAVDSRLPLDRDAMALNCYISGHEDGDARLLSNSSDVVPTASLENADNLKNQ